MLVARLMCSAVVMALTAVLRMCLGAKGEYGRAELVWR